MKRGKKPAQERKDAPQHRRGAPLRYLQGGKKVRQSEKNMNNQEGLSEQVPTEEIPSGNSKKAGERGRKEYTGEVKSSSRSFLNT